jgi:hypothetical protein
VFVARVEHLETLRDGGVEILQVRKLRLVQLLVDAGLDLAGQKVRRRDHDVVAGAARDELRLEQLVRIHHFVVDLDPGLLLEVLEHALFDVVRPVVDVDDFFGVGFDRGCGAGRGRRRLFFLAASDEQ